MDLPNVSTLCCIIPAPFTKPSLQESITSADFPSCFSPSSQKQGEVADRRGRDMAAVISQPVHRRSARLGCDAAPLGALASALAAMLRMLSWLVPGTTLTERDADHALPSPTDRGRCGCKQLIHQRLRYIFIYFFYTHCPSSRSIITFSRPDAHPPPRRNNKNQTKPKQAGQRRGSGDTQPHGRITSMM